MRALTGFLFPRRWKGQLAEVKRLLAADRPAPEGLGPRIDRWLGSCGWEVRNAAIKLIAHVGDASRYPRLLEKLGDRSEAGIVRRNAAEMLVRVGLRSPAARQALLEAIQDPYYETRTEALRALALLFEPAEDLEEALLGCLYGPRRQGRAREANFEVRMALAQALGTLGVSRAALDALAVLAEDSFWLVRSQAAVGLALFASRRPEWASEARERLLRLDRLSEGAVSYFVHRDVLRQALQAVRKGPGRVPPSEIRSLFLSPKAGWNHLRR